MKTSRAAPTPTNSCRAVEPDAPEPATPITSEVFDTNPSLTPNTAAQRPWAIATVPALTVLNAARVVRTVRLPQASESAGVRAFIDRHRGDSFWIVLVSPSVGMLGALEKRQHGSYCKQVSKPAQ